MVTHKAEFDENGAKWIWILAWDGGTTPTTAMAEDYYSGYGVNFGWFTDDRDNSWEPYAFHNTGMAGGVPWIGVIDADTMQVYASNPTDVMSVVRTLAAD
jgi:hypothetical protein